MENNNLFEKEFAERFEKERKEEAYQAYKRKRLETENTPEQNSTKENPSKPKQEKSKGFMSFLKGFKFNTKTRNSIILIIVALLISPVINTCERIRDNRRERKAQAIEQHIRDSVSTACLAAFTMWADSSLVKPYTEPRFLNRHHEAGCMAALNKTLGTLMLKHSMYMDLLSEAEASKDILRSRLAIERKRLKEDKDSPDMSSIREERIGFLLRFLGTKEQKAATIEEIKTRLSSVEQAMAPKQGEDGWITNMEATVEGARIRFTFVSPEESPWKLILLDLKEMTQN